MWKMICIALVQSIFLSGGQVLLKLALAASGPFRWSWAFFRAQLTNWWFPACGLSFSVATVLWFYLLKNYSFSIVYPLSCISYALGVLAAIFVFHEQVSWLQWLGIALIMGGCSLIVR